MRGRENTEGGYRSGAGNLDIRNDGRWSGDLGGLEEGRNVVGGRMRKDLSGTKKLVTYGRDFSDNLDAKITSNIN